MLIPMPPGAAKRLDKRQRLEEVQGLQSHIQDLSKKVEHRALDKLE